MRNKLHVVAVVAVFNLSPVQVWADCPSGARIFLVYFQLPGASAPIYDLEGRTTLLQGNRIVRSYAGVSNNVGFYCEDIDAATRIHIEATNSSGELCVYDGTVRQLTDRVRRGHDGGYGTTIGDQHDEVWDCE